MSIFIPSKSSFLSIPLISNAHICLHIQQIRLVSYHPTGKKSTNLLRYPYKGKVSISSRFLSVQKGKLSQFISFPWFLHKPYKTLNDDSLFFFLDAFPLLFLLHFTQTLKASPTTNNPNSSSPIPSRPLQFILFCGLAWSLSKNSNSTQLYFLPTKQQQRESEWEKTESSE